MAEIDTRLKTIAGLHVHLGYPGKLSALPAAVQYPPESIDFDLTYGRGTDVYPDLIVVIFVRRNTPRQAINDIAPYLKGAGPQSIKAVLDTATAGYTSAFDVQVQHANLDPLAAFGGGEFVAALFHLKITGSGA
jgi:hypothetical protein